MSVCAIPAPLPSCGPSDASVLPPAIRCADAPPALARLHAFARERGWAETDMQARGDQRRQSN